MSDEAPDLSPKLKAALAGRYEIHNELGRGGMATVYLATDIKHGRDVAIKVLHPELAATIGGDRFEREIRVAAKLQHPHILGMFDSGVAEGLLYYVMPYVKGESLRDRIDREGMLPIEDALQIALEVNDALGHAHAQGIIHRDIKPENILLANGHALVADFGIARAVEDGAGTKKLTQTGMSMGTAYYMAPEQSAGETVGPSADLYALGCVLYEMLTGDPPFTGKNAMQIMARHAMEQVPSIRIVRAVVPEEIEQAIYISMNKSPADRPQNAEQFAQLLGIISGNTSSMRMLTPTMQRRVPTGMHSVVADGPAKAWYLKPAVLVASVVGVAAIAFGAWKFGSGGGRAAATAGPEAHRLAVLYFGDASRDSSLGPVADGLTEGLTRSLSTASSFTVVSTSGTSRFRNSALPPDSIARALRVGYLVRGDVEAEGESIRVNVRLDDASGANLQRKSIAFPRAGIVTARDTLAVLVADLIRQQLGEQIQVAAQRASTGSMDAWLLLQRGDAARRAMEAAGRQDTVALNASYQTADSLYAAAESADASWADPTARRALIAYRRSRLTGDPAAIRRWVTAGLPHADRALEKDAESTDALEVRGNLKYWSWLQNLEEVAAKKAALIADAKTDLEKATSINRSQAGAFATLSHLYNNWQGSTPTDVVLAAQQAYQADEFLAEAEIVLSRLVLASYDLGQAEKADQWCAEARRRFPNGVRTARCELLVMTMRDRPFDVARAWKLADSVAALSGGAAAARMNAELLVAMVLAKGSKASPALADSARRVIKRAEGDPSMDPVRDLALYGAMAATALGDKAEAVRLLKSHLAVNPQKIVGFRDDPGWQFRDLMTDPAYRQLVGAR